jgi:hypothetical protein
MIYIMSSAILKYRFPVVLVCLAALCCLPPAIAQPQWSGGLADSGNDSNKVVFAFSAANPASVLVVAGERTRPHGFDSLSAIFGAQARIVFGRESISFLADDGVIADNVACLSATPIRAPPPLRHSR